MAIESPSTDLRDVPRERPIPLAPGEIVTTPGTIESLKIPDSVALRPENVTPFLANQFVRLNEITARPEIKSLEAAVPEYIHDDRAPVLSAMSQGEQQAFQSFREDVKSTLLQSQSGDADLDHLSEEIRGYIDEAASNNPDVFAQSGSDGSYDVMDQYFTGEMLKENEETKKKYQQLIAAARDPETVILLMADKQLRGIQATMGKLVTGYKAKMDDMDKLQAQLDLKGSSASGLSQADMMRGNMDSARLMGDTNQIFQLIQKTMSDYERIMVSSKSLIESSGKPGDVMTQNLRS
jgi:hypothetical protein